MIQSQPKSDLVKDYPAMQTSFRLALVWLCALVLVGPASLAGDGNRLTYLDDPLNPYYVGRNFPKLTTPMWIGEEGVEAVVVLAIDDMRGQEKWETYLRPILERLKQIDGRAPVSIMTCTIDPQDPHLQQWLKEGLSLEVHTIDHPCPLLKDGDFAKAKSTYDRCVDLLNQVPGNRPVAFRMPCCDSLNTVSPRFYHEIFGRTTPLLFSPSPGGGPSKLVGGNFLQIDTSVFNLITPNDPALPRELVFDRDGNDRFRKYIPADRTFVNTIEDYPYPYVIDRLCWEFPCVVPSDWSAQHLHKPNNPITVEDWKAALDAVVVKQGVYNLVFHPHGWIKAEQVIELIDHVAARHGHKVKFLTFREALDRLNKHLLDGHPLRMPRPDVAAPSFPGDHDNGVRLLDVTNDGFMDVVIGNDAKRTRIWQPADGTWKEVPFPIELVALPPEKRRPWVPERTRFGVLRRDGNAAVAQLADSRAIERHLLKASEAGKAPQPIDTISIWSFDGAKWAPEPAVQFPGPLEANSKLPPWLESGWAQDVRLRDLNRDGRCELVYTYRDNTRIGRPHAVFLEQPEAGQSWTPLALKCPVQDFTSPGLRFTDLNEDGFDDLIYSIRGDCSIHLFEPGQGWTRTVVDLRRKQEGPGRIPPIIRDDGTDNGFFVHSRHLFWQNENTNILNDLVDRRSFHELTKDVEPSPKSPEASLRCMQPRSGFEVELVAAEPLVMDPIALAWGPDGKLWVVEMGDYPLGTDGKGKHGGRVRFLEDTDGDGRYDNSTVFLDELGFPTGVMPWRQGVLVTCAPEIFYAEDTDGDGKADKREVLFTGFAQGNQQHRVNGLVWGLDNWIYGANGDSGGGITVVGSLREPEETRSRSERPTVNISGRDFRIRPDEGQIDPVTGQTQFGRSRDAWGNWFGCNNSNPMFQFVLPDHYIRRNPHVSAPDPRVNVSVVPGASPVFPVSRTLERFNDPNTANRFTSACSAIVYRDDLFGPHFEGNSFVSEPVHNLIHREVMSPRGVTFTSRRAPDEQTSEFLASSDNWFRPTMIQTGPDGALWIADMYRFVIEHPEWIPKEWQERLDLRAGHDKGRIYRVFPVDKRPRAIPRLDKLDTAGFVAALDSPNGWQRDMVQMMLLWRNDQAAAPALERLIETSERPASRLQALCSLDGLGALREPVLLRALGDTHPGVRRHAVRLAETRLTDSPALAEAVLRLATDSDAQVRMQVAFSLGEWNDARAGRALGQIVVRDSSDPFITGAVASSATRHAAEILAAVSALRESAATSDSGSPAELIGRLVGQIVAQDDAAALGRSLAEITRLPKNGKAEPWQVAAVASVVDALDRRGKSLAELAKGGDAELRSAVARLTELVQASRAVAADATATIPDRVAAVRLLGRGEYRSAGDLDTIVRLLSPQVPGELQEAAVAAAARLRDPQVPERLLDGWPSHGPRVRNAVLDTLLGRESWWVTLLDRIEAGKVPAAEIDAVHRQRMIDHKSSVVRDRADQLFGRSSDQSREKIIGEYREVAKLAGDRERGAAVFQKTCAMCHRVGEVGHEIGPDLGAMANRSTELFLAAILDPNRAVETRYLSYLAATRDGRIFTGMLAAETGNSVTLIAQEGKRETLLRTEIESLQSTGKSLMPDGMERDIPPQAMADLFAFLHSAGPSRKTFDGNKPEVVKPELLRHELYLLATNCEIYGRTLIFEEKYKNLGYWSSENDHAVWTFEVDRPGKFAVTLDYACDNGTAGNGYVLEVGDSQITGTVASSGNWDTYKQLRIGTLTLADGEHRLIFRPASTISGALIDLRGIKLSPVLPR